MIVDRGIRVGHGRIEGVRCLGGAPRCASAKWSTWLLRPRRPGHGRAAGTHGHWRHRGVALVGREDGEGKVLGGAVNEFRAQGAQVAAAGTAAVVAAAGRTGTGMKITGQGKFWPIRYDPTACLSSLVNLPSLVDQRTVGLDGKDGLADGPDRQRIEPAADRAQDQRGADRGPDVAENRAAAVVGGVAVALFSLLVFALLILRSPTVSTCYARFRKWTIWSISQIPGKGQMTPPTP